MAEAATGGADSGAILRVARFYHDPRGSMRAVLAGRPGEARLLGYAVVSVVFLLAGRLLRLFAEAGPETDLVARVTEQVVSLLFFLPLVYYAVAALGTSIARACGGEGSYLTGRAAFFWANLVSAPIILMTGLAAIAAGVSGPVPDILRQAGSVFFAWALACCYAEAFGFRSVSRVLAVIALIALVPLGLVWAIASN